MSAKRNPGASELDKCAHRVFMFANDKADNGWQDTRVCCARCGFPLESSYCEERLYMVRCRDCGIVSLVAGTSPRDAAAKIGTTGQPNREHNRGICAGGCVKNYADPLPHCDGCTFRERS